MNRKHVKWLLSELSALVERSVISRETAEKISDYYGKAVESGSGRRIALAVFGAFGSLLIGAGAILLIAHNWDSMSRPARAALAIAPLVISNLIGLWIILTDRRSTAWQEGAATGICLSLAASIALVGQTYHIGGDLGGFLFAWMILSIPLLYTFRAVVPFLIYLAGITGWAGYQAGRDLPTWFFWMLVAAAAPRLVMDARSNMYSARVAWPMWLLMPCVGFGLGFTLDYDCSATWIVAFSSLLALFYLSGRVLYDREQPAILRPFQTGGAIAITIFSFLLSFRFIWQELGHAALSADGLRDAAVAAVLLILCCMLAPFSVRRSGPAALLYGCAPAVAVASWSAHMSLEFRALAVAMNNLYIFALGIGTMISALRQSSLVLLNASMVVLASLILIRFFDLEIGLVARGIAFMAIGAAFLAANIVMARRFRAGGRK